MRRSQQDTRQHREFRSSRSSLAALASYLPPLNPNLHYFPSGD
jgi:hypothetical protein